MKKEKISGTVFQILKGLEKHDKNIFWKKENSRWKSITCKNYIEEIKRLSCSFSKILKIKKGDFVGIVSSTRYEWDLSEKAIMSLGAVVVGMNARFSSEEISDCILKYKLSSIIVEDKSILKKIPDKIKSIMKSIILISDERLKQPRTYYLNELLEKGSKDTKLPLANISRDTPITLILTSGTTGKSKGIIYNHSHIYSSILSFMKAYGSALAELKNTIIWMPLDHLTSRMVISVNLIAGIESYFLPNPRDILSALKDVQPCYFMAVPRFYQKVQEGILQELAKKSYFKRILFGMMHSSRGNIKIKFISSLIDSLVFNKLRFEIGFSKIQFFISGSASLDLDTIRFFLGLGLPVYEAYGTSENTIPISMNNPDDHKFGTLGKPLPENNLLFSKENEILVKGPGLFKGYFKEKNKSKIFNKKGYFSTGDIGILDKDGYLKLTGRRKDIIKTSTGVRISPCKVEEAYSSIPYVKQVIVFGNNKKYLVGLVTLNKDEIKKWTISKKKNINLNNMHKDKEIFSLINKCILEKEKKLSDFEKIKRFAILENNFSISRKEITHTLKLRRHVIEKEYKKIIKDLYK